MATRLPPFTGSAFFYLGSYRANSSRISEQLASLFYQSKSSPNRNSSGTVFPCFPTPTRSASTSRSNRGAPDPRSLKARYCPLSINMNRRDSLALASSGDLLNASFILDSIFEMHSDGFVFKRHSRISNTAPVTLAPSFQMLTLPPSMVTLPTFFETRNSMFPDNISIFIPCLSFSLLALNSSVTILIISVSVGSLFSPVRRAIILGLISSNIEVNCLLYSVFTLLLTALSACIVSWLYSGLRAINSSRVSRSNST